MPSTYSKDLSLILQATGENPTTWGVLANTNFAPLIESAICGVYPVVYSSDADLTMTIPNGADASGPTTAGRYYILKLTSGVSLTVTRKLIAPLVGGDGTPINKTYMVINATTGGQSIQVIGATGTGVTIPNGTTQLVYTDGTNYNNLLGSAANYPIGTSGATVPLLNGINTWSGTQSFQTGVLQLLGNVSGATALNAPSTGGGVLTFPQGTDTVVTLTATQTLTNKTLTNPSINTIFNGGTLTFPNISDTLVGRTTTDTLSNKTIDTNAPNVIKITGIQLTGVTGTGGTVVLAAGPTITGGASINCAQTGLAVQGASVNALTIKPNETLSSTRTLSIIVNDANRTLNLGGDFTTSGTVTIPAGTILTTSTGLQKSQNLADVNNAATSLSNLGGIAKTANGIPQQGITFSLSGGSYSLINSFGGVTASRTATGTVSVTMGSTALNMSYFTSGTAENGGSGDGVACCGPNSTISANSTYTFHFRNCSSKTLVDVTQVCLMFY